jgi:putative hemolysin
LPLGRLPYEDYQTVGTMVIAGLGRVPAVGDSFEWEGWRFEVVNMDGSRVEKVLTTLPDTQQAAPPVTRMLACQLLRIVPLL